MSAFLGAPIFFARSWGDDLRRISLNIEMISRPIYDMAH